jgi:putative addiction module component (TIGR02574 family)
MTRKELVGQLLRLSPDERMQAAEELWESLVNEPDGPFELSHKQLQELDRRMEEHERDPSSAIPWEVVRARLLTKFE